MLVIESSLGHTFQSTDDPKQDSCLTCGGTWQRVPGYREGIEKYVASNGDDAQHCTYLTDISHGYEQVCQDNNGRGCDEYERGDECAHLAHVHGCNCLQCA